MSKILSREEILGAMDLAPVEIEVPEWGGSIKIRALSLAEVEELLGELRDEKGEVDAVKANIAMFVHSVVEPQFGPEDYDALRRKHGGAMLRVIQQITSHAGLTQEDLTGAREGF